MKNLIHTDYWRLQRKITEDHGVLLTKSRLQIIRLQKITGQAYEITATLWTPRTFVTYTEDLNTILEI